MKIWPLEPVHGLPAEDDPWEPWYDKVFGQVIRAEAEADARMIAQENGEDECRRAFATPWLEARYSTCVELIADGEPGLILKHCAFA